MTWYPDGYDLDRAIDPPDEPETDKCMLLNRIYNALYKSSTDSAMSSGYFARVALLKGFLVNTAR